MKGSVDHQGYSSRKDIGLYNSRISAISSKNKARQRSFTQIEDDFKTDSSEFESAASFSDSEHFVVRPNLDDRRFSFQNIYEFKSE